MYSYPGLGKLLKSNNNNNNNIKERKLLDEKFPQLKDFEPKNHREGYSNRCQNSFMFMDDSSVFVIRR